MPGQAARSRRAGWSATPSADWISPVLAALDEDFNISAAWGLVFEWVRENEQGIWRSASLPRPPPPPRWPPGTEWIPFSALGCRRRSANSRRVASVAGSARQAARKAKDFKRSDAIRDEFKAKGWTIEDTPKARDLKHL